MKQKDFLIILIPTFIITVLWVLFSVYHNYTTSTIKSPLDIQIIPISGTFDMETITQIKSRQQVTPEYNSQDAPDPNVEITPEPTEELVEENIDTDFIEEGTEIIEEEFVDEEFTEENFTEDEFIEEEIIE